MKKQLLIAALLMGAYFTTNAQTVYEGTFNDDAALEGWGFIDADADTNNWQVYTGDATTDGWGLSGNFIGSRSWVDPAGAPPPTALTPDNYAVSPVITLAAGENYVLTFDVGVTYYAAADGNPEKISVYVTNSAEPTAAELSALTPIYTETYGTEYVTTSQMKSVDLSDYAGQNVRIAFRHYESTNQEIVFVDNVIVAQGELGTENHLSSQFAVYPNPANDVVNIANAQNMLVNGVSIIDINGRTVKTANFDNVSEAQINISELAAGVYMMNITSDKGTAIKKIVKN